MRSGSVTRLAAAAGVAAVLVVAVGALGSLPSAAASHSVGVRQALPAAAPPTTAPGRDAALPAQRMPRLMATMPRLKARAPSERAATQGKVGGELLGPITRSLTSVRTAVGALERRTGQSLKTLNLDVNLGVFH